MIMRANDLEHIIDEGVNDPHIFKAIFTAGAPGSGKSTVVQRLTAGSGLRLVDIDRFWHLFNKKGVSTGDIKQDYEQYWELARKQKTNYINGRLGLIIDGTARVVDRVRNIKDRLNEMGYDSMMVFVNTDLQTAINRAMVRGEQTGRTLTPEFITTYYNDIQNNLGALQQLFRGQFQIIDNSADNGPANLGYTEKAVRKFLTSPVQNPIAREWIKAQGELRQSTSSADTSSVDRQP